MIWIRCKAREVAVPPNQICGESAEKKIGLVLVLKHEKLKNDLSVYLLPKIGNFCMKKIWVQSFPFRFVTTLPIHEKKKVLAWSRLFFRSLFSTSMSLVDLSVQKLFSLGWVFEMASCSLKHLMMQDCESAALC